MGIGGVLGIDQMNHTRLPPKNGSLSVGSGLKVYGGSSANPTTELTQFSTIYSDDYNETTVYRYMIVSAPLHEHSFTYALNAAGDTITATCNAADKETTCPLKEKGYKATLTIAPSSTGGYGASLSGDAAEFGVTDENIEYSSDNGTTWSTTVPSTAGSYQARIIVIDAADNTKTRTAMVSYGVEGNHNRQNVLPILITAWSPLRRLPPRTRPLRLKHRRRLFSWKA